MKPPRARLLFFPGLLLPAFLLLVVKVARWKDGFQISGGCGAVAMADEGRLEWCRLRYGTGIFEWPNSPDQVAS